MKKIWNLAAPAAIATALVATGTVGGGDGAGGPGNAPPIADAAFVGGQAALDRLGETLPAIAAANGLNPGELQRMLLADRTLLVDRVGGLAYFDEIPPGETVETAPGDTSTAAAPPVDGPEFQLASLPGAELTIYLDFDGHVTTGTTWNAAYGVDTITSPPYDTDNDPDSWSQSELDIIEASWAAVAEDFAPWQVNVTTVDPGADALRYSGNGDTRWGARVVITDDTFAGCGCGGHAYIGSFDDTTDEPTFVYTSSFRGVAEAISHEVGHMLYLAHDGVLDGPSYYRGHDGEGPGWAPIMGVGYYEEVTQWSQQEYSGANNTGESGNYGQGADDIDVIGRSSLRNIPPRVDDHADGAQGATALSGSTVAESGIITTRTDVDAFTFTTDGGSIDITASPAAVLPNLDILLSVVDGNGNVIAADNPASTQGAAISVSLGAGTYTILVDGVGVGDPTVDPPSGYTDYGSLGQYTLSGTITGGAPPDTTPPAVPTGLQGSEVDGEVRLSWIANTDADLAGYVVERDTGGGFADIATVDTTSFVDGNAPTGGVAYRISATDNSGNRSAASNAVTVVVPVNLVSTATAQTTLSGTVWGSLADTAALDGVTQTITEISSGGKPSNRHDLAEHVWQLPATSGGHQLRIVATATDGGDADNGFVFDVSSDGSSWMPVAAATGGSIDVTVDIGQRTGTIHVRVVDTDRSRGQRSFDTIAVDLIEATGDGIVVENPDPTSMAASLDVSTVSAGQGRQSGVATVQLVDDQGQPVGGVTVEVVFSGDFAETVSGVTGSDGRAIVVTTAAVRKPAFSACVASATGSLQYVTGTEACAP